MADFQPADNGSEISLDEITNELEALISLANEGKAFDDQRMDVLIALRDQHPVYKQKLLDEKMLFREQAEPFLISALDITRSFIPVNIHEVSSATLLDLGLSQELAKRLLEKKCLWLVRMSEEEIARLHEADLYNRFQITTNGLDLFEVGAIFASCPHVFPNDPTGRKNKWLDDLEGLLKRMLAEKNKNVLPKQFRRSPAYSTMPSPVAGPIEDRDSVRDTEAAVKGSATRRKSFAETCKIHSILSKSGVSFPRGDSLIPPFPEGDEEEEDDDDEGGVSGKATLGAATEDEMR